LYNSNLLLGVPSSSRTWICAIAAPAFAASIEAVAICSGVFGKSGCLLAVSPDPVTAHDIKTLLLINYNLNIV
jgi:stage V sporulation protein SpoVS